MVTFPPGRLATSKSDYSAHVGGTADNHSAGDITFTPIVSPSIPGTDVQTAIAQVATLASITPPNAVSGTPGIISLDGDIGGTYNNITVTGLQNVDIAVTTPTSDQVLTYDSLTKWTPKAIPIQTVLGVAFGTAQINAQTTTFNDATPTIDMGTVSALDGNTFSILGQNTIGPNKNGGNIFISGGSYDGASNFAGKVSLQMGERTGPTALPPTLMLETTEVVAGEKILSLVTESAPTTTNLPSGSGNKVVFIGDCSAAPSTNPTGGFTIYSDSGVAKVIDVAGSRRIGVADEIINPYYANNSDGYFLEFKVSMTSSTATPVDLFIYTLPNNSSVYIEANIIGKVVGDQKAAYYTLSNSYVIGTGSVIDGGVGPTTIYTKLIGTPPLTSIPDFVVLSNSVIVKSGARNAITYHWQAVIKIVQVKD